MKSCFIAMAARWGTWNGTRWGAGSGTTTLTLEAGVARGQHSWKLLASMPRFTERGSLEPGVQWKATRLTARERRLQLGPKRNEHPGKKPSTSSRPGASSRLPPLEEKTQAPGRPRPAQRGSWGGARPQRPSSSGIALSRESLASPRPESSPTIAPSPLQGWPAIGFVHVAS